MLRQYSANVPLNTNAIACGLILAVSLCLIFELLIAAGKALLRLGRRNRQPA